MLAGGGGMARALALAARLGIPDILNGGALPAPEIARRTASDPDVLARLLQTLAFCGVFTCDEAGGFALSPDFAPLRADHRCSVRNLAILMAETYDDACAALPETVRTGRSAFRHVFGVPLYEFRGMRRRRVGLCTAPESVPVRVRRPARRRCAGRGVRRSVAGECRGGVSPGWPGRPA
ncbi:methyltransferase family protein [Uniformispora flossi]|uniref:methyltransferase family protein n=1 Tax=Uniformispora flossi TaxID=3390723 RepID=UPI003C2FF0BC